MFENKKIEPFFQAIKVAGKYFKVKKFKTFQELFVIFKEFLGPLFDEKKIQGLFKTFQGPWEPCCKYRDRGIT